MKLAWFIHRYHPCVGGAETYARAMVRRMVADGHEVDVFTSDAHDLWYFTDRTRRRVDAPGVSEVDGAVVHRLPVQHFPFQKYVGRLLSYSPHWPTRCRWESYMPVIPAVERVEGRYDAAFGVGFPFTVFSLAARKVARAAGSPLILTPFLHLSTPDDPVSRHYTRPHQARLLREADLVVTPTALEARVVESWGVAASNLLTLPMAIEPGAVCGGDGLRLRSRLGIGPSEPVVGQLGALDPNKGTIDLVRALREINKRRIVNNPVHLVLAGAPSPAFEASLAESPAAPEPWLHVLGPIPAGDVPDFYDAIDLFAMPSRTDSFGIVFLEAWANGKPVVAAEAGGVVEVVRHEENGLLVPFGAVPEIAGSIERLLRDRGLAERLARAGREVATGPGSSWDDRYDVLRDRVERLRLGTNRARRLGGRRARVDPSSDHYAITD